MSVKNIECQLAEAQIGRYLSGGAMSPEALIQLEGHIGECAECKGFLAEKRAGLQAMLMGSAVVHAPPTASDVEPADPEPATASKFAWLQRFQRPAAPLEDDSQDAPEALEALPASKTLLKPLALSGALAVVLVAMSFVSRNPNALLGEKALPPSQPASSPVPAKSVSTQPAATTPPVAASTQPVSTPPEAAPKPVAPKPKPVAQTAASKPVAKRAPKRRTSSTPRPKAAPNPAPASQHGSIRVYDSQGNPVTPSKTR